MKKLLFVPIVILISCNAARDPKEKSKAEIIQAEKDFAQAAKEKGIANAFYAFADDSAVIRRGPGVIKGKEAIKAFYENQKEQSELTWSPDFADASGDIGYTYGKFTFSVKDSAGKVNEVKGYFHTVWKKQKDGTWKFVWD